MWLALLLVGFWLGAAGCAKPATPTGGEQKQRKKRELSKRRAKLAEARDGSFRELTEYLRETNEKRSTDRRQSARSVWKKRQNKKREFKRNEKKKKRT